MNKNMSRSRAGERARAGANPKKGAVAQSGYLDHLASDRHLHDVQGEVLPPSVLVEGDLAGETLEADVLDLLQDPHLVVNVRGGGHEGDIDNDVDDKDGDDTEGADDDDNVKVANPVFPGVGFIPATEVAALDGFPERLALGQEQCGMMIPGGWAGRKRIWTVRILTFLPSRKSRPSFLTRLLKVLMSRFT